MNPSRTLSYRLIQYRESRRDKRLRWPVFEVHVDGQIWQTENWSLGGLLLVRPYEGPLEPQDTVSGHMTGQTQNGLESIAFTARVVRYMRRNQALALQFERLDEPLLSFLERCLQRQSRSTE